jgi:hypothetical protein
LWWGCLRRSPFETHYRASSSNDDDMKLNKLTALLAGLTLLALGASCTTPDKKTDAEPVEASMSATSSTAPIHGHPESN